MIIPNYGNETASSSPSIDDDTHTREREMGRRRSERSRRCGRSQVCGFNGIRWKIYQRFERRTDLVPIGVPGLRRDFQQQERGGGAGIRFEVNVRTTLEAMNLPLSSEGAQEALFRMRRWTKKESSAEDGKGQIKHTKRI